jgi:DNA-directed RNA polymerase specialized sigma24 family protein
MADEGPNRESFEALLTWLDPDRDKAWEKYQAIWYRLTKIFILCRCKNVEDLAGEVVKRVERKVPEVFNKVFEDRAPYFYKVAYNLLLELPRQEARFSEFQEESGVGGITYPVYPDEIDFDELRLRCLDECLDQLNEKDRKIIRGYYVFEQKTKLADRERQAKELGMGRSALWTKVSRIRRILRLCVRACLDREVQTQRSN